MYLLRHPDTHRPPIVFTPPPTSTRPSPLDWFAALPFPPFPRAPNGAMVNTVAWGGMSFDDQNGSLALEKDELRVHWSTAPGGPNPPARSDALIEVCCDTPTIKSAFCKDPLESFLGERGTIHPLGGCCLADTAATGGCNHKGQLFDGSSATSVHEGLYVSKEWSVCVDALS